METIANIVVSLPDTIAIATTPEEVVFHSCPVATTQLDIELAHEIATSILCGIGIIGIILILCLTVTAVSKYAEQRLRLKHEERKRNDDQKMQEYKNRLDSAWHCLNDFYKKKEQGFTDSEKKMADASWQFLTTTFKESQLTNSNQGTNQGTNQGK